MPTSRLCSFVCIYGELIYCYIQTNAVPALGEGKEGKEGGGGGGGANTIALLDPNRIIYLVQRPCGSTPLNADRIVAQVFPAASGVKPGEYVCLSPLCAYARDHHSCARECAV